MSTDQTHISVVTDEALTGGLKSWSRGQKSQAASAICSGGVSAVMGSSDLDAHTFGSRGATGNQLPCSLPFEPEPSDAGFDLLGQGDRVIDLLGVTSTQQESTSPLITFRESSAQLPKQLC